MRDEVLMGLVDKALNDRAFREKARTDLQSALSEHGYELTEEEYAAVEGFQERTAGMSEEEVDRALAGNASGGPRQFGA